MMSNTKREFALKTGGNVQDLKFKLKARLAACTFSAEESNRNGTHTARIDFPGDIGSNLPKTRLSAEIGSLMSRVAVVARSPLAELRKQRQLARRDFLARKNVQMQSVCENDTKLNEPTVYSHSKAKFRIHERRVKEVIGLLEKEKERLFVIETNIARYQKSLVHSHSEISVKPTPTPGTKVERLVVPVSLMASYINESMRIDVPPTPNRENLSPGSYIYTDEEPSRIEDIKLTQKSFSNTRYMRGYSRPNYLLKISSTVEP